MPLSGDCAPIPEYRFELSLGGTSELHGADGNVYYLELSGGFGSEVFFTAEEPTGAVVFESGPEEFPGSVRVTSYPGLGPTYCVQGGGVSEGLPFAWYICDDLSAAQVSRNDSPVPVLGR